MTYLNLKIDLYFQNIARTLEKIICKAQLYMCKLYAQLSKKIIYM